MNRFRVFYAYTKEEEPIHKKRLGSEIIRAKNSKEALKLFAEANSGKVPLIAQVV